MKVSEKSLELNIGAELLARLRALPQLRKLYLRGLTQREERREGVDFFAQLPSGTRLFAFQFKAPKENADSLPYRYTIFRYQHDPLFKLAAGNPGCVFYVFPFYGTTFKLHQDLPKLGLDTWLLDISGMDPVSTFNYFESRTIKCDRGTATINPTHSVHPLTEMSFGASSGIDPVRFNHWYRSYREAVGKNREAARPSHRNSWLARGLRIGIAIP